MWKVGAMFSGYRTKAHLRRRIAQLQLEVETEKLKRELLEAQHSSVVHREQKVLMPSMS